MIKGEDTKESWCRWSCQVERHKSSNIEIEVEDCEEYTASFSFYVISGSYLSHSPYGGRDFWSHFEASQLKEDVTAYKRRRHLREGVWAVIEALDQTAP